ncbi:MAG: radical SAM protein [Candidatus Lokiarchaeota archaeon]|nr:radical SAM protein [Candidatus Lokiarchaeota archaeon]
MIPVKPKHVQIEISSRCNLECYLCPKGRGEVKRDILDLDINKFRLLMDELEKFDPKIQLWNYGEPLMHPQINKILNLINNRFSYCSISTNGQIMNQKLAQIIVNCGLTKIIFSIDGITQKSYEKYRKRGDFEKSITNLKKIIRAKEEYNSNIDITVQFIIFKHNIHELSKLGAFFFPMGVNEIMVKSAIMMFYNEDKEMKKIARNYLDLKYRGERYKIKNGNLKYRGSPLPFCPIIDNSFVVTSDMDFLVCCWDYKSKFVINNKNQLSKAKKIINSKNPPTMCRYCPLRNQITYNWDWKKIPFSYVR